MKPAFLFLLLAVSSVQAEVSFTRDIAPIFRDSCNGCHRPGKEKGGLDLTTYASLMKGSKHGAIVAAHSGGESKLLDEITGPEPSMPKEGDPLKPNQIALIRRWIEEGAVDDTPAAVDTPIFPPIYSSPPIITAMAFSGDGKWLAVSGSREVLLLNAETLELHSRLVGRPPRIESLEFSPDSALLAVAASSPGVSGEIQIWEVAPARQSHAFRIGNDALYGVHWSSEASRVAFGCADKTVRVIQVTDGKELIHFDQHSDWVFGAVFVDSGKRIVSGSRDRSLKLIDATSGALLDVINRDTEPVLCLAKHPIEDWVVFGSDVRPRLYKAQPKPDNINLDRDPNFIREFENFENGVTAVAFTPNGKFLASSGNPPGEVRVHAVENGQKKAVLKGHEGIVFALSFSADGARLATAGFEGCVRLFDWANEKLLTNFFPLSRIEVSSSSAAAHLPIRSR